jgi:CRP/FNR family cyclic AMP-dependent transcriptional regulator
MESTDYSPTLPRSPDPAGGTGRSLAEWPELTRRAAELLRTPTAFAQLAEVDAHCVAAHMQRLAIPAGTTLMQEGDQLRTGYMLLLLQGEVSIETTSVGGAGNVPISVLGPGNLIGELGLLDGAPRSASCVAVTNIDVAALSRHAVARLIDIHPTVGAKLMAAVAQRLGERLRASGEQLRIYADLVAQQHDQIVALQAQAQAQAAARR